MTKIVNIAAVILNYNSADDLFKCAADLNEQRGINLTIIIIDNASESKEKSSIRIWKENNFPEAICGSVEQVLLEPFKENSEINDFFLVFNNENSGYSAGNNIGIKLADKLGMDGVLIANPDMQFKNKDYVSILAEVLFSNNRFFITASKIVGIDGNDQSPMREPTFFEELLWPRQVFTKFFKTKTFILPYISGQAVDVPKVMGCSLLLKMDFLNEIGYLDENVFLYSEEAILSAQVKKHNGKIMFVPYVSATHAHIKSTKGNSYLRMLNFIRSRKYYIRKYSDYNKVQKSLLYFSYGVLALVHKIKAEGIN